MKAIEIANKHHVDETLVSHIRHSRKYTDNIDLAVDIATITGEKPISYIRPKLHTLALAAHPELGRKVKKSA